MARFDAGDRTHAGHPVRTDGHNLARPHQTVVNTLPSPVRGDIAFARRRPSLTRESGTDEMVLAKEPLETFVRCAYVMHG
jgi:hypothetical protein